MKSKSQLIQENLLAELEKVSEIEFFKKAGKAVSGVATGLDKLSNLGKKIQDYDPAKPTVKKTKDEFGADGVQRNISDTGKAIDDLQALNRLRPDARQDAIIKTQSPEQQIIARKSQLMKKHRMTPDKLEKAQQEKSEKAAIAKSISRQKKKRPSGIATGIAKSAPVAPTPVPGQKAKANKQSKLPAIGGILPTDPRYPALAAKVAAAEKNK